MRVTDILETCLYADDLPAAADFYQHVLGLELDSLQEGKHVFFRCGARMLLIFDAHASSKVNGDLPPHGSSGVAHLAFGVPERDLDRWKQKLESVGVGIETDYLWPHGGRSLYFRDPHGNLLELATPSIWRISEDTLARV
jgi:catechol 2,3-dioxygenase-like lactoylglutathione lyase family enzyme